MMCYFTPAPVHDNGFQKAKDRLIQAVKGTSDSKTVRRVLKQHEVESFESIPEGYMDEWGNRYQYKITYIDKYSLSENNFNHEVHTMYFGKIN